jgi:hypothetical protein
MSNSIVNLQLELLKYKADVLNDVIIKKIKTDQKCSNPEEIINYIKLLWDQLYILSLNK